VSLICTAYILEFLEMSTTRSLSVALGILILAACIVGVIIVMYDGGITYSPGSLKKTYAVQKPVPSQVT